MKAEKVENCMDVIPGVMGFAMANWSKYSIIMAVKALDKLHDLFLASMNYHKTGLYSSDLAAISRMKEDETYAVSLTYHELQFVAAHYCRVENCARELSEVPIAMPLSNPNTKKVDYIKFPCFAHVVDHADNHTVTFQFSRAILFYLLRCEYGLHSIDTSALLHMKSLHAMHLYIFLSCWVAAGYCHCTYLQLMHILCPGKSTNDLKYARMSTVDRAVTELDELLKHHISRCSCSYKLKTIKDKATKRRRVSSVKFFLIFRKTPVEEEHDALLNNISRKRVSTRLITLLNFTEKAAARYTQSMSFEKESQVMHAINNALRKQADCSLRGVSFNPYAYLRSAFRNIFGHDI